MSEWLIRRLAGENVGVYDDGNEHAQACRFEAEILHRKYRAGQVSEWPKEHAWKVCIRKRIEGSNPSLTAIKFMH